MYKKRRKHKKAGFQSSWFSRYGKTLIRQIIACIIILLLVIVIKKMDIAIANKSLETFHTYLGKEYTGEEILESAKEVFSNVSEIPASVFVSVEEANKRLAFSPPASEAAVISTFGEQSAYYGQNQYGFERGMKFYSDNEIQVYAAGGGTVAEVGEGGYIKVTHGNNVESVYRGCTNIYVVPLEKVKKGQLISSIANEEENVLTFELWIDGEVVNPADYIEF